MLRMDSLYVACIGYIVYVKYSDILAVNPPIFFYIPSRVLHHLFLSREEPLNISFLLVWFVSCPIAVTVRDSSFVS